MDIEKLIAEITDEIYDKVSAESCGSSGSSGTGMNIARYLDDTLLKADATPEQIIKICKEAKEYKCASVWE